jgi:hypothetical protein
MTDDQNPESYCRKDKRRSVKRAREVPDDVVSSSINHESYYSSSSQLERKSRRSYTTATKIEWVREFQSCPQGTTMRSWLQTKNKAEGTNVTYASFRRWVTNFQNVTDKNASTNVSSVVNNVPSCPLTALEDVLAQFLKLRNSRLRASEEPISSPNYIKAKALEFYEEMYGNDSTFEFRASNSWLHDFLESHKNALDPEDSTHDDREVVRDFASANQELELPTSERQSSVNCHISGKQSRTDNRLTLKDIHFFQQIILQSANTPKKESK